MLRRSLTSNISKIMQDIATHTHTPLQFLGVICCACCAAGLRLQPQQDHGGHGLWRQHGHQQPALAGARGAGRPARHARLGELDVLYLFVRSLLVMLAGAQSVGRPACHARLGKHCRLISSAFLGACCCCGLLLEVLGGQRATLGLVSKHPLACRGLPFFPWVAVASAGPCRRCGAAGALQQRLLRGCTASSPFWLLPQPSGSPCAALSAARPCAVGPLPSYLLAPCSAGSAWRQGCAVLCWQARTRAGPYPCCSQGTRHCHLALALPRLLPASADGHALPHSSALRLAPSRCAALTLR
jgi:hypothetical protein